MPPLIDLLQPSKLHWLTVPRYAVIAVPLLLATGSSASGQGTVALPLLLIATLGCVRLVWLKRLPHEWARLDKAKHALNAAQPDRAIGILLKPLALAGTHYQVKRAVLLARAYCHQGDFIKAHEVLSAHDTRYLLPDEQLSLQIAWAQLFIEADNPAEARRRLADISDQECQANLNCLLLKAELALQDEHYPQARTLLESGLDHCKEPADRVLLHNNMARLEGLQGHRDAQLRHLQSARVEFSKAPRAGLTDIVHHNLAIALVRKGQPEDAKAVLREAFAAGDTSGLAHVIAVLNNHLHTAREAGYADWVRNIYAEFDRQLERLKPRTSREQLALDITQLRMMRNDGISCTIDNYPELIEHLLDRLATTTPAVPISERVAGLVELRHDLKREIETELQQTNKVPVQLINLMQQSAQQLLKHTATIETYLSNLSPKLIGPLTLWHRYRTDADKARIELAEGSTNLQAAFNALFDHLREKAEWLAEQGTAQQTIEAWLIICDELVAYHDQWPPAAQPSWRAQYSDLAQHALDQATALMAGLKHHRQQVDQLIGLAYFNLRLREDKVAAARWMRVVKMYEPSLDHYASWLRGHYGFVCGELDGAFYV
ncbi:tetratricopeptide repeat protein [Marinobacterium marinum]|uniref:Tetratricopeptide repeat protein n=1 Tax=Marinobacterium marinum TaxID=2756129 RepID=A0A7W1WWN2_9GAMM|nr:hypothetical protein [Marinobacterium marinum]MBA4501518.1 hypothetical protein [Marinobacterium marinum]